MRLFFAVEMRTKTFGWQLKKRFTRLTYAIAYMRTLNVRQTHRIKVLVKN